MFFFGKPWKHFEENRSLPLFAKATKSISDFVCGGGNRLKSLLKKKHVILSYKCSQLFAERCTRYRTCTCMARVCGIHILDNNILHPQKLANSLKKDHPQRNFHLRITDVHGLCCFRGLYYIYIHCIFIYIYTSTWPLTLLPAIFGTPNGPTQKTRWNQLS